MSINRTVLVGRLTKDPELKFTPSGIAMARFTVAVNRAFSNENGEKETDFINCIAWRKQAENLCNFQKKGNLIGLEGRIQTGSYEGQDGKRVYTTDIVADSIQFLDSKKEAQPGQAPQQQQYQQPMQQQQFVQQQQPQFTQQQNFGHLTPMNQQQGQQFAQQMGAVVQESDFPF